MNKKSSKIILLLIGTAGFVWLLLMILMIIPPIFRITPNDAFDLIVNVFIVFIVFIFEIFVLTCISYILEKLSNND